MQKKLLQNRKTDFRHFAHGIVGMVSKTVKRLKDWYKGYGEYPEWFRFCSLVFAFSSSTFIIWFFGPAILGGDVIGYWMYQSQALSAVGSPYIVILVATFMIAVISGILIFRYEWKRR
jgi:hypothetical protein